MVRPFLIANQGGNELNNQKEIIRKINDLFIMTRFQYLILNENGEYKTYKTSQSPNVKKLNDYTIKRHLEGKATLGVFAGKEFTKFICFDVDVIDKNMAKWTVYKLVNGLIDLGIPDSRIYISTSGNKGYHVEIYFNRPIKNTVAYQFYLLTLNYTGLLNIDYGKVEFRPNSLKRGVKIPLGINFKNKRKARCWYVDYDKGLKPVKRHNYILSIEQIDVQILYDILNARDDLYDEKEVIKVEETRDYLESKVKSLPSYNQNVDENETIEAIQKILFEGLKQTGTRNNALFKLAKYFRYQGLDKAECKEMLIEWMSRQNKNTYTTKWEDCLKEIEHIHNYVYDNDIQLTVPQKELSVSYEEMKQIMKLKSKNEKLLAYCMLIHSKRFAMKNGVFYMSFKQMSEASGLSKNTPMNLIPRLAEAGIIDIVEKNRKQDGTYRKKPNKYKVNIVQTDLKSPRFTLVCNNIHYSDSFNHCVLNLFTNDELKRLVTRHQYYEYIQLRNTL